eukprot:GHVO01009994.1.p1 GENE.GHVO01009994.1~~GHVO01009994.1.p1  ORF type:complete len:123 (+),score=15.37 GHVO01009994.1:24-371(+)
MFDSRLLASSALVWFTKGMWADGRGQRLHHSEGVRLLMGDCEDGSVMWLGRYLLGRAFADLSLFVSGCNMCEGAESIKITDVDLKNPLRIFRWHRHLLQLLELKEVSASRMHRIS